MKTENITEKIGELFSAIPEAKLVFIQWLHDTSGQSAPVVCWGKTQHIANQLRRRGVTVSVIKRQQWPLIQAITQPITSESVAAFLNR